MVKNIIQHHLTIPPLENGDRLTRTEFERRYQRMPNLKKAELKELLVKNIKILSISCLNNFNL
jgi:hypothetical protein